MNPALAQAFRRPDSLHAVAEAASAGEAFDPALREFLDAFYLGAPLMRRAALAAEPARLAPVKDAYLAAVAEHLALRFELDTPPWTEAPHRFLREPYFAGGMESLKAILLVESPLAFRRRNIFVSADALSRPRDPDIGRDPRYRADGDR
jgi:hypothetical protein